MYRNTECVYVFHVHAIIRICIPYLNFLHTLFSQVSTANKQLTVYSPKAYKNPDPLNEKSTANSLPPTSVGAEYTVLVTEKLHNCNMRRKYKKEGSVAIVYDEFFIESAQVGHVYTCTHTYACMHECVKIFST